MIELIRTSHLKEFIVNRYPIAENKFDIIKIGERIWIYAVTMDFTLERYLLFKGALSTVEEIPHLRLHLIRNIELALEEFGYLRYKNKRNE